MRRLPIVISLLSAGALALASLTWRQLWIDEKIADANGASRAIGLSDTPTFSNDGRPRLLLLGDSRLSRWRPGPEAERWDALNRALGGETTAQLATRFESELHRYRPDYIVVSSGINDIIGISFMPEAVARQALARLVALYSVFAAEAARVQAKLIITTIVPPSRPNLLRRFAWSPTAVALTREANSALRSSAWPSNTSLLDLDAMPPQDPDGFLLPRYSSDTLHFNWEGYELYGKAILNALAARSTDSGQQDAD